MIEEIRYTNKVDAIEAVSQDGTELAHVSAELRNHREVVMAAVQKNGFALEYASAELRNDREIVIAAVSQNGFALLHVSDELWDDQEVVIAAVEQNGYALQRVSNELRNDQSVVLAAVKRHGSALCYASAELRNDPKVVIVAVKGSGLALQFASEELQEDPDIVMAAVKQDGWAFRYASEALRSDPEVVLEAIKQDISSIEFAKLSYQDKLKLLNHTPAQAAIENQEEAGSRILGCVGMFVDQMRKDCGSLKKEYESNDISFEDYYEHIISYISVRDIDLLSQFSTNRYVEDESEAGKIIKRSPRRENEHKNDDGMKFASITKEDREKGVKRFVNVSYCQDALIGLNYDRC